MGVLSLITRKRWSMLAIFLGVAIASTAWASGVAADSTTVNACVMTTSSTPVSGVLISYNPGDYYRNFGTTNSSGCASGNLPSGIDSFQATYGSTSAVQSNVTVSGPATEVTFTTTTVNVHVQNSSHAAIQGAAISYNPNASYPRPFGTTDATGLATMQLFANNSVIFYASIGGTSASQTVTTADPATEVTFTTGTVTLQFSGGLSYNPGDYSRPFSKPTMNLFGGTYTFSVGKYGYPTENFDITVPDAGSVTKSIYYVRLRNSNGSGVAGGTVHLGVSGWPVVGTTGSDGVLVFTRDGLAGNIQTKADAPNVGGSQTSPYQNQATNSFFDFQTVQAVIQLKDSVGNLTNGGTVEVGFSGWPVLGTTGDNGLGTVTHEMFAGNYNFIVVFNGTSEEQVNQNIATPVVFQTIKAEVDLIDHAGTPLSGGVVRFGISGWPVIGTTDASGKVTRELFPGTYNFQMVYNYTTQQLGQDIATPVVFQTALVNLHFSGTIQHQYSGWPTYTGPLEMLPVTHTFGFSAPGHTQELLTFTPTAGTVFEKTIIYITVKSGDGSGASGVSATWRNSSGPTSPVPGDTNTNGHLLFAIDGHPTNTNITVMYGDTSQGLWQNPSTNSLYDFQLVDVTIKLLDHSGNGLDSGTASFYAGGWHNSGTTTGGQIHIEMLPGTYAFAMVYNGERNQISQAITANSIVVFQTKLVTLSLEDHGGNLMDSGSGSYYAGGWHNLGTTTSGQITEEMLPGTYAFAMVYNGERNQFSQDISANQNVLFQTKLATVKLLDHSGGGIAGGVATYYAGGWHAFGTTDVSGQAQQEMLPGAYAFAMVYNGERNQFSQDISANQNVVFQTVLATIKLEDHNGNPLDTGNVSYYAGGWHTIGDTSGGQIQTEMLPGSYSFAMTYLGTRQQLNGQDVANPVVFQTGQVQSTSGNATSYYAGGWKPFTQDMELLPGTYAFSFTGHPQTSYAVTGGTINTIY